jgi:hypothetical protein
MPLYNAEVKKDSNKKITSSVSDYRPAPAEAEAILLVKKAALLGYTNKSTPRREYNDLSEFERISVDQMSWNTYQPNDGNGYEGDVVNSWRSNAMRPIVRNKCISIAAHATARLIFPNVFAQNREDDEDQDAAIVMRDLVEYVMNESKYPRKFIGGVINALVNPMSVMHVEYTQVYRTVKDINEDGTITSKEIIDDEFSGFQISPVDLDEFYYENFYETDLQKQGFVMWRKVISYDSACAKYSEYDNFQYVKPGMQTIADDPNNTFYNEYDMNLAGELVEEVMYWNRKKDLFLIVCNGVLLTEAENPNPRADKKYPFAKTFYEPFDSKCFTGKSLVFKMGPDARIVNELYPMIIDGTYLQIFPPMWVKGTEEIGTDVIIPGAVTILSGADADLKAVNTGSNLAAGFNAMNEVISSINQSSVDPIIEGQSVPGNKTAYEIAKIQQNAQSDMSMLIKMIGFLVEDLGNLIVSDILQYMTVGQVEELTTDGQMKLAYKSFLLPEKQTENGLKSRKIKFDLSMPSEDVEENEILDMSYDILAEEGGPNSKKEIMKVNPQVFRERKYRIVVAPDYMNPLSEELERTLGLEAYDRLIASPRIAQDENALDAVTRDFLLNLYPQSKKNPEKYLPQEGSKKMMSAPVNVPGGPSPATAQTLNQVAAPRPNVGM